jgi:hypothetical protein
MLLNIRDHIRNHFTFTLIIILKVSSAVEWDIQFENLGSFFLRAMDQDWERWSMDENYSTSIVESNGVWN